MKKIKKSTIIVLIVVIILFVLLFLPIMSERVKMKRQLGKIYNDVDKIISEKTDNLPSDYSEYFDLKTLEYSINKVYYTEYDDYGIEIDFNVLSDYDFDFSWDTEFALATYDLRDLFKDDYKEIFFSNSKYNLNINGKTVFSYVYGGVYDEFIQESYEKYKVDVPLDKIIWEYSIDGIKLVDRTDYINVLLIFFSAVVLIILFIAIVLFLKEMYDNASDGVQTGIYILSRIIVYFIVYVAIGIFSGGVGFIALPLLFILESRR